jgi:ABC-type Na+ efflux pump permease subunit
MATWRAKCWLGSANGFQELEVQSNTVHGADEQLRRIYGAEQVINLRQVNESKGSTSSSDASSLFPFAIVLLLIWLMIEYWYIFIPIFVILVILFLIGSTDD